jgi:hypothetical protein
VAVRTKTRALGELRGFTAQHPSPTRAPESQPNKPSPEAGRTGRPPATEKTMQISLRLPEAWVTALRREAIKASTAEDRMISPQEVVRRLVGQGLKIDG